PRVEFRRHDVNRGHIATYNEGLLEWAGGDYCLLISADDYLAPGALRRAALILDRHPEVVLAHGPAVKVYSNEPSRPPEPVIEDESYRISSGPEFLNLLCSTAENPVATPSAVLRTA